MKCKECRQREQGIVKIKRQRKCNFGWNKNPVL